MGSGVSRPAPPPPQPPSSWPLALHLLAVFVVIHAGERLVRIAVDVRVRSTHVPVPRPAHVTLGGSTQEASAAWLGVAVPCLRLPLPWALLSPLVKFPGTGFSLSPLKAFRSVPAYFHCITHSSRTFPFASRSRSTLPGKTLPHCVQRDSERGYGRGCGLGCGRSSPGGSPGSGFPGNPGGRDHI